jgi:serine/threonine protein kinase
MECIKGGDLKLLIQEGLQKDKLVWKTMAASHYAMQLAMAVEFLHQQSTVHADLKPDNVLVTPNGKLQLADFGSAFCFESGPHSSSGPIANNAASPVLGATMDYASPEILRGTPIAELGIATDLWSLGCILGAMQWGESPFHSASDALALDVIMNYANGTKLPSLLNNDCEGDDMPEGWKSLILGLLNPNPGLRLGVDGSLLSDLIPGKKSIDLSVDPPFLPPESKWIRDSKTISMADGSQGWSAFLL